jgi:hypothetical protein
MDDGGVGSSLQGSEYLPRLSCYTEQARMQSVITGHVLPWAGCPFLHHAFTVQSRQETRRAAPAGPPSKIPVRSTLYLALFG